MSDRVNEVRIEKSDLNFAQMNGYAESLDYFQATSAEALLEQIKKVRQPMQILGFYAMGNIHFVWFKVQGKIKKVTKRSK